MNRRQYAKLVGSATLGGLVGSTSATAADKTPREIFRKAQQIAVEQTEQEMIEYLRNNGFSILSRATSSRPLGKDGLAPTAIEESDLSLSCTTAKSSYSDKVFADAHFKATAQDDSYLDFDGGEPPADVVSLGWPEEDYDRAPGEQPGNPYSTGPITEVLGTSGSGIGWGINDGDQADPGPGNVIWEGNVSCELVYNTGSAPRYVQAEYMHNWTNPDTSTSVGVGFSSTGDISISYGATTDTEVEEWNDTEKAYD